MTELHIAIEPGQNIARRIYDQIRDAIVSGRLRHGERLPSSRELASRIAVARNTVSIAYEWLIAEAMLETRGPAGTFVALERRASSRVGRAARRTPHRSVWHRIAVPPPDRVAPPFDFGVGKPDAALFPFDVWRRLVARQTRASRLTSDYGDPAGHPKLRAAIAHSVAISRGVKATPDDVIVTNGAQQAFDLIARVLVEPDARAAFEEPGYPPARLLLASAGARVVPVRVDDSGLDPEAVPDDARLIYVTPSHQFPLGMPLTHARRVALLEHAVRRNAVIVEDDYDSEFRFGGRPLETLQSIDRAGRVIYVGSFSKSMLPALRLGFLIAPPSLREPLRAAAYVAGWFVQWATQAALASFIDDGLLAKHVRKMRRVYAERHERILGALIAGVGRWLEPVPSVTGMHLAARLRSGNEGEIARRALAHGVGFDRLSAYCVSDPQPGIVLGYGGIATKKIDEGLRRLRAAFTRAR